MRLAAMTLVVLIGVASPPAYAQDTTRLEFGGGVHWSGGLSYGGADANESTSTGGTTALFTTASRLGAAPGVDGRLGWILNRSLQVEGSVSFRRPQLRTEISADIEGIPGIEAVEDITELAFEGALVLHLRHWSVGGAAPFLAGGGGYLRQLHQGRQLVEGGQTAFVGGGISVIPGGGAGPGKWGLRVDGRLTLQRDGVALDAGVHAAPRVGASVAFGF